MDIQFYGANCIVISNKQVRLVFDDNLESLGAKSISRDGDVRLFTTPHPQLIKQAKMVIDMPGEYEISGVNVRGLQSRGHMDTETERNAVMYKVTIGETKILITGHVYPKFTEAKLEDIGLVDVMLIPVGGNGFTLDPTGALQVIKQVEPKVVVPTHYADATLNFEVPQQTLEDAVKAIGMEPQEVAKKLQYKASDTPSETRLIILEKV